MRIEFLRPQGPQPTEKIGLAEFRQKLPMAWKGYANFTLCIPKRYGHDREIDVVIIAPDRLILVDLKHVRGKIESRSGTWFKGNEDYGPSAYYKIRDNAKFLAEIIRRQVHQIPGCPPIESAVVFTHEQSDLSGLDATERENCFKLSDFIRIGNENEFRKTYCGRSSFGTSAPLNTGPFYQALQKLFANGRLIEASRAKYHGFVPTGQPEFSHRLYEEYPCHEAGDPNYTGLLRLWRFDEDPDAFSIEEERRPVAERERSVLGYLRAGNSQLYDNYVMRSIAYDREYPLRHSEVFERHVGLARLTRFVGSLVDHDRDRRLEFAKLFLDRVAALHRLRVAHRDLDRHSVWIDERRSNVVLSSFGAAHYPDRETIGAKRSKILAGGFRTPEDTGAGKRGTPFQTDVFLAAAVVWTLLTGERLPEIDEVPVWTAMTSDRPDVPADLGPWFDAALSINATDRPVDVVEAAQQFANIIHRSQVVSLERQLERYRQEIDPVADHDVLDWISRKPVRVFKAQRIGGAAGETVLVKSWPENFLGDRRKAAPRLIEFFARADKIQTLSAPWAPRIHTACLSMDGLLLAQEWLEGQTLDPKATAQWSDEEIRAFLMGLVTATEELHAVGLTHGDLKPDNILVSRAPANDPEKAESSEQKPTPILLDLLDYAPDASGERRTQAYCPPNDEDNPLIRDRFAVCAIALELAENRPTSSPLANEIRASAVKCGAEEAPWLTMKYLRKAVSGQQAKRKDRDQAEEFHLTFELRSPGFEGKLLADNGRFHVVQKDRHQVEIFGFDQKLTIEIDPADHRPKRAFVARADVRAVGWALGRRILSFPGTIQIAHSRILRFSGIEALLSRLSEHTAYQTRGASSVSVSDGDDVAEALSLPDPGAVDEEMAAFEGADTPSPATRPADGKSLPEPRKKPWRFPVARFWRETIAVEEAIQPELTLDQPPAETGEAGVVILRCTETSKEETSEAIELGDAQGGVSVSFNGSKIGDVDLGRSRAGVVTLRNARGYRRLRTGDRLRIQNSGSVGSFQRRSKALTRVVQGLGQLPELVSYFDPLAQLEPRVMADEVPKGLLQRYGLNEEQEAAFNHLWKFGPLGLLQGPPGTGKTSFIASFVHHALNEGKMRNVLVLSQSHEAVNEVAERILKVSNTVGGEIDLLRIGDHEKISSSLQKFHSQSVQDRYRELFRAELKDRMLIPARRLGLETEFIRDIFEIEATYGPIVRQMSLARREIDDDIAPELAKTAQIRLQALSAAFERRLSVEHRSFEGEPDEVFEEMLDDAARRHRVFDPDATRRLARLNALSLNWSQALGLRGRTLEEFLARSRNLVCGTCVGIGRPGLRIDRGAFDLVVIDEAARCTPSELAVGMQSGKRVLLVGDHKQLPPLFDHELIRTVSERLKAPSLAELRRSDFERAFRSGYGKAVAQTLVRQYRMASEIHALVSGTFYNSEGLVRSRPEPLDLYALLPTPLDKQVIWLDSSGKSSTEAQAGTSFTNRREALTVIELLRRIGRSRPFLDRLSELELKEGEHLIGVICMYAQQAELISSLVVSSDLPQELRNLIKVDTVDAYQGKQNRIVILSLVRSNFERDMGHVRSRNRINVALSRAMDRLLIIGAARMFETSKNPLRPIVRKLKTLDRISSASDILGRQQ
ncbi:MULTISPECIES: AAA domain-containing protein [unclassified Bosea (in: a-proteobacteria)]|uniref:AAA domain-containing protein n=1 Tax=unclassified Bosea (in: a-proteobacteria) TaxID=2653178 RepID=UPI00125F7307|nr:MULTISPECIES: AAA domain-containing protein [unclassified Bosea (in: a-proteobacteria)]